MVSPLGSLARMDEVVGRGLLLRQHCVRGRAGHLAVGRRHATVIFSAAVIF